MLYQSANRDHRVFDDPDRLVLDRDPNPHVAFGIGTHYCLGANLARMEVKVVFQELLRHLPDLRVPDGRHTAAGLVESGARVGEGSRRCSHPVPA